MQEIEGAAPLSTGQQVNIVSDRAALSACIRDSFARFPYDTVESTNHLSAGTFHMNFDPQQLDPQSCYRLLVCSIVPRPIAWISTVSASGVSNLAPYSFFTVASCNPPVLSVTQVNPRNRLAKDTLANLQVSGECVVNIVNAELAQQMNATCADYPSDVSEFSAVGIEREASLAVAPEGVKAAPVRFECKLRQVIEVAPGAFGGTLMLLDVVNIYVVDQILVDEQVAPHLLDAIGKLGGDHYSTIRERFELARPILPR